MFGKRPGWLGIATLYAAVLIIPVVLYVFVYQGSRIDQATMRNFRALEAAAKRIEEVLKNMPKVATNSSLGVDQKLLKDISDLCSSKESSNRDSGEATSDKSVCNVDPVCPYEKESCKHDSGVAEVARKLNVSIDKDGDKSNIKAGLSEVSKAACMLHKEVSSYRDNLDFKANLKRLDRTVSTGKSTGETECRDGRSFIRDGNLVSHDCRYLRERNKQLYEALNKIKDVKKEAVKVLIGVLDLFGVEISMPIDDAFDDATRHLSMFFDNHFIADANGQVIFHGDPLRSGHDTLQPLGVRAPFSRFAKITDILDEPAAKSVIPYSTSTQVPQMEAPSKAGFTHVGHSIVRSVYVDDVELSVFIHPFTIDKSLSYAPDDTDDSSMLYIAGVVRQASLAREAIRLRLGAVVDATLMIAILLAILPIFRFWAAGDRSILGHFGLYGIGASAIGASALGTTLIWGVVTKHSDGEALDSRLIHISEDIRGTFLRDLANTTSALKADVICMSNGDNCKQCGHDLKKPEKILNAFWCPPKSSSKGQSDQLQDNPKVWCPQDLPEYISKGSSSVNQGQNGCGRFKVSFLLDKNGRMESCRDYRHTRTSRLDLSFRNYFMNPKRCHIWHLEESKGSDELRKFSELKALNGFILERIDSVVQGRKEVVVSYPLVEASETKLGRGPGAKHRMAPRRVVKVAAAVARFESIDRPVLPPHFHYAVVENESGKTLFHSDADRVSVSNFIDDTGNDPAISAAMRTMTSNDKIVLGVNYDGMPIRAHIRPLLEPREVPWTLIVFREHRLVDRMSSLSTSLSIISWLAITLLLIIVLFAVLGPVRRKCGYSAISPSVVLPLVNCKVATTALVTGVAGLALSYICRDLALCIAVLLYISCAAGLYYYAWRHSSSNCSKRSCLALGKNDGDEGRKVGQGFRLLLTLAKGKLSVMAAVILSLAIFPVLSFQFYFQAQLSKGLAMYLEEKSINAMEEKVKDLKEYADEFSTQPKPKDMRSLLRSSVVGYNESTENKMIEEYLSSSGCANKGNNCDRLKEGWAFDVLRPLIAYSSTSQAIMRYRAKSDGSNGIDSLPAAFDEVVGKMKDERKQNEDNSTSLVWLVSTLVIAVLLLFCFLCYSVVRTMFGHAKKIALLPCFYPEDEPDDGKPLRMQLVKWSDQDLDGLIKLWRKKFIVKIAKWDDVVQRWDWDIPAENYPKHGEGRTIYVVRSLREATRGMRANILAADLSQAMQQGTSIVLCSDVVPAYRLSPGASDHSDKTHLTWSSDWDDLTRDFEVRRLCRENAGNNEAECSKVREKCRCVEKVMHAEAKANRDLEHVALEVAKQISKANEAPNQDGQPTCSQLRDKALRQFRAAAQPRFKALWAVSSRDERLQLIALARGGAPNIRQSAAISSLANRGLITTQDPLQLRSEAFGQFIKDDLTYEHELLAKWRRRGHGNWWGMTWLPLVVLAGLGLLFFVNSNPEAIATLAAIGAALVGIAPVVTSLLRIGQSAPPTSSGED